MKKLGNKGFSVIEGLLIVVVIAVIGFVVWHVRQNNQSQDQQPAQSSATPAQTAKKTPDSEIKSGPGSEWNTYINHKLGFSIQVPKKISATGGDSCIKEGFVYDNYGEKVSAPSHFTPKVGITPAIIVEDGNDFYVTSKYSYQQTGLYDYGDGYRLATGCKKLETNAAAIVESGKTDSTYSIDKLPFSVVNVSNQTDITTWVQKHFSKDVFVKNIKTNQNGWQDVTLSCKDKDNFCLNFGFQLRYYKTQNKLVYLEQGQAGQIAKPDNQNYYDRDIFASFKLN